MKKSCILVCSVLMSVSSLTGQGFETFRNFPATGGSYTSGSFSGADGSAWNYTQCRGDKYIESPTPCLGKRRNPLAKIISGTICNGCRTLIFSYRQAFSTAVNLDILVNGILVKNVVSAGGSADTAIVYSSDSIAVNQPGDFIIEFRQADSLNSGQACIDNVFWTKFQQGVGIDEATNKEGMNKAVCIISLHGKRIHVCCHNDEDKILSIFSLDGRLIWEQDFSGREADLRLDNCREGICVAILREKHKNILAKIKLVLK
jgi:hypothetical protein